ncbi:MAG: AAA family ATPase, partial [Gammaproteobacteria bacterium]|nr:AAA family ATPase [Gammaproteobacteria bacterium]
DPRGGALAARVRASAPVAALLAGVRTAESLEQALGLRRGLAPGESVVTRDGVWAGAGWLRVARADETSDGVLSREQQIKEQAARYDELETEVARRELDLGTANETLTQAEHSLGESQQALADSHHRVAELTAEIATERAAHDQARARAVTVSAELADIDTQLAAEREVLDLARRRWQRSSAEVERLGLEREEWTRRRDEHRRRQEELQERWQAAREEAYELGLRVESLRAQMDSLGKGRARNEEQIRQLEARIESLGESLSASDAPLGEAQADLEEKLAARGRIDERLREARTRMEDCESAVRELEASRHGHEERVTEQRAQLETLRLEAQEVRVRRKTVEEQFAGLGEGLESVLERVPDDAEPETWEEKLADLERRITRLGPINLAAIEEHEQQAERKSYLDAQHQDLEEALATLTAAIQKIDRETRARFKETYEKVNAGVGAMFPRLFGGGHAYLQLTGDDLLSTGVSVMARPPGKRNTSIHLLSGGEKALAAIALVFAIFELNPAPFCLLDEVDAPLDDVNVVRFCDLVKDMAERVQFIVVTHNKITMEIA